MVYNMDLLVFVRFPVNMVCCIGFIICFKPLSYTKRRPICRTICM